MGVIKKADCTIGVSSSVSEETLYIPSSDDEHSHSEVSNTVHISHRVSRHRVPTIGPQFGGLKLTAGKKKARRYHNVNQLVTLAEDDELDEVSIFDFVPSSKTRFTQLLEDDKSRQRWDDFVSLNDEAQSMLLQSTSPPNQQIPTVATGLTPVIKTLRKHKTLPLGMLKYLEDELVSFFCSCPTNIYISPVLTSFQRLLLHGLSDYHHLASLSFDSEPEKIRLVKVKNPRTEFPTPQPLLVQYLEQLDKC